MFLIRREISNYTNADLVIGVYESDKKAQIAKNLYIKQCATSDVWKDQAYRDVNLAEDVKITDVSEILSFTPTKETASIYVVSLLFEGMGQVNREIKKIFDSKIEANTFIEKQELEEGFVSYCILEEMRLNEIHPDIDKQY